MAEEAGTREASGPQGFVLGGAAMDSPEARDYLRRQSELTALQIEDIKHDNHIRSLSLRFSHASMVMKLVFELSLGGILVCAAVSLIAVVWTASRDNSLVIETFNVPPDLAGRGLNGQTVAAQLQDNLAAMQAATDSGRPASSYVNNWGNDIKVQIPDTGVSVSEFYRLLVAWLGHQTHISGEIWHSGDQIAVTARVGAEAGSTVRGSETDLPALLRQSAEKIYERTQPYRYAVYLAEGFSSHAAEARQILETLASACNQRERAWAWSGLSGVDILSSDPRRALADLHKAIALAPNMAVAHGSLDFTESFFGHDEAALDAAKDAVRLLKGSGDVDVRDSARAIFLANEEANVAFALNDFNAAVDFGRQAQELPDYSGYVENGRLNEVLGRARLHNGIVAHQIMRDFPPSPSETVTAGRIMSEAIVDYWLGNWQAVLARNVKVKQSYQKANSGLGASNVYLEDGLAIQWWPYLATAMAETGDSKNAHALIDRTPIDCYACVRSRAIIDEVEKHWDGAAFWFGLAANEAPSLPFAYAQWGQMLLDEGHFDAAIDKFNIAHQKSPHFADPLEMWGEALIAKNRSDLALTKFGEANKYAPNWGRLHLKWGEALIWSGDKADAAKQFAVASTLDLAPSEKSELANVSHG
jgi:tetratricopeptide (TPR) repeat protein